MGGEHRAGRARRCRGDGGIALVEAAFVAPVFVLIIFGILEYGGAFRDFLTVSNSSLGGTRQAAIQGNSTDADWNIVQAVKKAAVAMPLGEIKKIVVYKAASPTDPVPASCKTGSQSGPTVYCNYYDPSMIALTTQPPEWKTCLSPSPTRYYCSTSRQVGVASVQPSPQPNGPDYVGVYVETVHPFITGLFGSALTLSDTSVTRLEPQKL